MPSDKGVLKIVDEHKPNMAGSMNQEDFEDLKQSFAMFDRNGDGKISTKELGVVMRSMGMKPTEKELKSIIDEVDKDGDGEVDFEEFVSTMSRTQQRQEIDDKEIRRAFDVFDQNGDGKITLSELKVVMSTIGEDMTESDLAEMMKGADLNNDGYISYEEFCKAMKSKVIID